MRNGIFAGRKMERDVKGKGAGFPSVLSLAQFSARSLTLARDSFLRNSMEMLATQATGAGKK